MNRDDEMERNRRERSGGERFDEMERGREDRSFGSGRYGREDRWGAEGRFGRSEGERWRDERRESGFGGDNRYPGGPQDERWSTRSGYDHDLGDRGPAGWGGPQWGNEGYTMGRSRERGYGRFDEGRGWDYPGQRGATGWGNEPYTGGREFRGGYGYDERGGYGLGSGYGMSNRNYGGLDWSEGRRRLGRGPKGYQRSDERIREDVCDMMTDHDWLDASEVEVQVKNGEVTLLGTVLDRMSKRMAEDLAERARGVKDVHNQLRVKQEEQRSETGGRETTTTRPEKQPRA